MLLPNQSLKILFFATLVFVFHTDALSQLQQPNRFEKERKFNDNDFTLISLKTDGIALIREVHEFKGGNQTWEVILLDSALRETEPIEFEVDNDYHLTGYEHSAGAVYFLFDEGNMRGYMSLVAIDLKTKQLNHYEIKPELSLHVTHFCKVGESFAFGGFVNRESAVLLYTPATDNIKVVPGFFHKETELVDMRVNQNQTFNTILIDRLDPMMKRLIFKTFDVTGKQILEDIVSIDGDIE